MSELKTDVLICGAGPFGLLVALSLSQQGISTYVIGGWDNSLGVLDWN